MSFSPNRDSQFRSSVQTPSAPPHSAGTDRPPHAEGANEERWGWFEASPGKLTMALVCGVVFGFLLQKGGVAKFDILIGVLLLENFVVVEVMLSAIVVGMVGVYALRRAGRLEPKISDTNLGANVVGGLVFGVGFGLLAYCPGTTAAAVGQGNLDALVGIAGLLFGSYLFALSSRFTSGTITRWGRKGKLTFPELLHVPAGTFVAVAAPALVAVLVLLELFGP